MKRSPVVNRGCRELCPHIFVSPDSFALGPGSRFIATLANEREALAPVIPDQVTYGVEFADFAAPPGIDCGRTLPFKGLPEGCGAIGADDFKSIVPGSIINIGIGFWKFKAGISKEHRDFSNCF